MYNFKVLQIGIDFETIIKANGFDIDGGAIVFYIEEAHVQQNIASYPVSQFVVLKTDD